MKVLKKISLYFIIIIIFMANVVCANTKIESKKTEAKSTWYIDTNLGQTFFTEKEYLHIEGWKLATIENTKLKVFLDEKEVSESCIKYSYKYDLISIVKGYGTYKENPTPNFDIDIPMKSVSVGTHKLIIKFVNSDSSEVLQSIEKNIVVSRNIKHILNIDTNLEGKTFDKSGIEIKGWKLASEVDTKLSVLIDGKEVENTKVEMYYLYDLISIVKGYGTYKENPNPIFTISVPTNKLKQGKHKIEILFKTKDDIVLEKVENNIIINKKIKSVLNIDTNLAEQCGAINGITIDGWKLSTEPNTRIEMYISNRKIENLQVSYSYRYDLISIVKGYGTYKENPKPNFTIIVPETEFKEGDNKVTLKLVDEQNDVLEEFSSSILEYKTRIHIETPYDRTSITNEEHHVSGWVMTTVANVNVRVLLDGKYQDIDVERNERPDVIKAISGYGGEKINPKPGFDLKLDFSKLNIGLHQIALRIEKENGTIVGEQVIYIFTRPKITMEKGTYGVSGLTKAGDSRGSKLQYYRYGDGPNVFFATFAIHGFEDNWAKDGTALVNIADQFYEELKNNHDANYELSNKWTIYILPEINPDGRKYGTTANGPGRTTLYSQAPNNKGIDMNRCWKYTGYSENTTDRNYIGTAPFQAYEAQYLKDFLQKHKSKNGQTVLVDLHGWYQQLVGDREVGMYYAVQFPENHGRSLDRYGDGYLIDWARARTCK